MRVVVKLFAGARELAGSEQVEVELASGALVSDLRIALLAAYPSLTPLLPHAMFAIDATYAGESVQVPANAEIACIPPVSGG